MAMIVNNRSMQLVMQDMNATIEPGVRDAAKKYIENMKNTCDELGLSVTSDMTVYLAQARTVQDFRNAMAMIERAMHSELNRRVFVAPDTAYIEFFERSTLFGESVFNAFPSAADDIFEAGSCLALERSTACVMHLMRVMECGLAALAGAVAVEKQNDWGSYLREITRELTQRAKTSGARSPDEQFYAEAAASFDHVRRAWRNPTMHVEHTYPPKRAKEILEAVKSFMNHLSTKISEERRA
ncbi:MAG TPA: hypothetical protein VGF92_05515 [Stellaceae bacterium]|jgi:hypothetical protein